MDPIEIVNQCYNRLPIYLKNCPWSATDHGRAILTTEQQLDAYIAAYGEMHVVKCRAALQNFPFNNLNLNFEIFDWGCGQGLATLSLLEFLKERNLLGRLNAITLIEPSTIALIRAKNWIEQSVSPGVRVKAINKAIPTNIDSELNDIVCDSHVSINLFSNVLDIMDLSLFWLANKASSMANTNYMICVGPNFSKNTRIKDFCGYFNPQSYFSNIEANLYAYTTRTHHPYSCETKCFVHNKQTPIDNHYKEHAQIQKITDDYEYAIECYRGVVNDRVLSFYNNLKNECGSTFNVFIRPKIGIDTPDVILANNIKGIVIINVCDNIDNLEKCIDQVENIKGYLFNTHLRTIKMDSIINRSVYGCVKTALFFPNSTKESVEAKLHELNVSKNKHLKSTKYKDYFEYLMRLFPEDSLSNRINSLSSHNFKFDYYDELIKIITGYWHSYKEGDTSFRLSDKQKDIVRSSNNRLRIKGVAGCGKTQIIANRAVEKHLQTGEKVLIITFNISLIQYIRMRINQVPADFSTNMFEITNYHQFFISMANRYSDNSLSLADFDNPQYFAPYAQITERYKTILIDEVQDFKTEWLSSIINYFLATDGSVSVFGDGEQNIFERKVEQETKMPSIPSFSGRWNEVNDRISMRIINPDIAELSHKFATTFIDKNIQPLSITNQLVFEKYWIKYWNVGKGKSSYTLNQNINWILSNYNIDPRKVTILSESINILRDIEKEYINSTHRFTMTNFETAEQYEQLIEKQHSPTLLQKDLKDIRRTAKTHFTTDYNGIKISTIHSFKGWESDTIILLLQPEMKTDESYEGYSIQERENIPALIYTALTRARYNLFILNLGNEKYHSFFRINIQ